MKKRKAKADQESDIELTFNPSDIRIFNSASGIMQQITRELKKGKNKDGTLRTAKQKQAIVEERFGDIIAKAEIANIEALKYIMDKATELIAKDPSLAPGFMRWMETSTNNVKAQRGLTRLPLIQYVDGSMEADETHVFYDQAKKFAIERSTAMYDKLPAKTKKEVTTTTTTAKGACCAEKAKTTEKSAATTGCSESQMKSCAASGAACGSSAQKKVEKK